MSPFTLRPAERRNVSLLIGLAGPSGGGKSLSALKLARGLAGDQPFAFIDTESGRGLMYADDCEPWDHGELIAPFSPERYDEAIQTADKAGYGVIVVDSFSHEHAGDGGLLDLHSAELDRMAGDDWKKREAFAFAAWVRPKQSHKRLMYHLLQLHAHLIICLRAEPKVEITKDERGKIKVVPKRSLIGTDGWIPVAEKNLAFELSMSLLVLPDRPGYPRPVKLPEMFKPFLPLDRPITEDTGAALAKWAAGGVSGPANGRRRAPAPKLTSELLDLAERMGKRDAVAEAINRNRQATAAEPARHVAWLAHQLERARAAVPEAAAVGAETGA